MKSTSKVLLLLLQDAAAKCSTVMQMKDYITICNRLSHEGLSFVTITLPDFLKDFMLCLEEGMVTSDRFVGWKKRQCLPAFLSGFTSLVFCSKTGRILQDENIHAIQSVRQICSFYKKIKLACSSDRTHSAFVSYERIEDSLQTLMVDIDEDNYTFFGQVCDLLWSTVFGGEVRSADLIPHHGPGSTADHILGNKKYIPKTIDWHSRLESHFSVSDCFYNTEESRYYDDVEITKKGCDEELPVRVITVPKTLKTPRIIALEPTVMQMTQQSVKDYIVAKLEGHKLTAGHINFTDQSINQQLALKASSNRCYATLDLSAASDRVHKDLVWRMLRVNPSLRNLVFVTRSSHAQLPDGKLIALHKFASMGSALCFPIEAMFFTSLLVMAYIKRRALPLTLPSLYKAMSNTFVYGDDIIIPTNEVENAVTTLTEFGNVVGLDKSFKKGFFRESCGMDAYKGRNITPVYMRNPIPRNLKDASGVISTVATINQLYEKGFITLATYLLGQVELVTGNLPVASADSEGLSVIFGSGDTKTRFNRNLQRVEVRTLVPSLSLKSDKLTGYSALTKCLLKLELPRKVYDTKSINTWQHLKNMMTAQNVNDSKHLAFSSRNGVLTLKRRWVAA
jgi:hypothetical protein